MSSDILLVRDGEGFRLLHGYLRMVAVLSMDNQVVAHVKGEKGRATIHRTPHGLRVAKDSLHLPLYLN
jgi:hypothetical protein